MRLLRIGTRVYHSKHGRGTIVDYNGAPPVKDDNILSNKDRFFIVGGNSDEVSAVVAGMVSAVYDGRCYPYRIHFDDNHEDVYGPLDISIVV